MVFSAHFSAEHPRMDTPATEGTDSERPRGASFSSGGTSAATERASAPRTTKADHGKAPPKPEAVTGLWKVGLGCEYGVLKNALLRRSPISLQPRGRLSSAIQSRTLALTGVLPLSEPPPQPDSTIVLTLFVLYHTTFVHLCTKCAQLRKCKRPVSAFGIRE